jgi:uncharacterized membrane protein
MQKINKWLAILLSAAILLLLIVIIFLALSPHEQDKFTEFYILNVNGKAANYPRQVKLGDQVEVIVGVINHENKRMSYKITLKNGDAEIGAFETGILQANDKWENKINFTMNKTGKNQKINFYLFVANEPSPHIEDPLTMIIDVAQP